MLSSSKIFFNIFILIMHNLEAFNFDGDLVTNKVHSRRYKCILPIFLGAHIAENSKSGFEYEWVEKIEAGVQLMGTEVKSCRKGTVQISDGFADIVNGECWLMNVHIAGHDRCGPYYQHSPKRNRKLLLHHREILKLEQRVLQRNYEIIPIRMYFSEKNFVKVELGVGKPKSLGDKRDGVEKREGEREIRRAMKNGYD